LVQNLKAPYNLEHINSALRMSGFKKTTPFQQQVFPAILSGKNLIAETRDAAGIEITFILPLLLKEFKNTTSAIILSDTPIDTQQIEKTSKMLSTNNQFSNTIATIGYNGNPGTDISLLKKKPTIIIGHSDRIIDHIRRNNIIIKNIETLIIIIPQLQNIQNFEQNALFIASKLTQKAQIQIYIDDLHNQLYEMEKILNHPAKLLYTERKKFDTITKGVTSVDKEKTEQRIKSIIQEIKANPDDIAEYRKIFKKNVPIFLRSYFAAKLLMDSQGSSYKSARRVPSGNMKTLFISIGRRRKVNARDLLKLFQKALDVKSTQIGSIKVLDNYSFIDLEENLSKKAVEIMNGMEYRGRKISVDFARKRT